MRNDTWSNLALPSEIDVEATLNDFKHLINKWNRVAGLVSPGDLSHLQARHIDDSLALQEFVGDGQTLLDIGSGGGFPGVPLAICNPQMTVTLLERNKKKCGFLRHAAMALGLTHVDVLETDVRSLHNHGKMFDVITSRAVAKPEKILAWGRHLLEPKGFLLLQSTEPLAQPLQGTKTRSYPSACIGWIHKVELTQS